MPSDRRLSAGRLSILSPRLTAAFGAWTDASFARGDSHATPEMRGLGRRQERDHVH